MGNAPHPKNVAGDFYVVDGCCTGCGVPEGTAPDLFGWDEDHHCFVKRQPTTGSDFDNALRTLRGAELQCIRYRGADVAVMQRIADLGELELCDFGARHGLKPVLRDHVTFEAAQSSELSALGIAGAFRDSLLARSVPTYKVRGISVSRGVASLSVSWYEEHYHPVFFQDIDRSAGRWLIRHDGNVGLSDLLHEWLSAERQFTNIRWYAKESWTGEKAWRRTPW